MPTPPLTGPEAIQHALSLLDLDALEKEQRGVIRSKKKTARPRAVRLINIIGGMRKNEIRPDQLMLSSVPVIPPAFRPFSVTGDTFLPGDANELYRDLLEYRRLYRETEEALGREGSGEVYGDLHDAVRAAFGYGESPNPKTRSRGVKGFFETVVGTTPKTGFFQSKMLAKPVDNVGRGVIIPDADLGLNDVAIPRDMAWRMYGSYVQRRLVRSGMSPAAALKHVTERSAQAQKALEAELPHRPVVLTRAPVWHRFGVIGQNPRLTDGDAIRINTFITDGAGADFDGDTMAVHVPSGEEAIADVRERLMADKMLFSIKNPDKVVPVPKHEQLVVLGDAASGKRHKFRNEDEAMAAIDSGAVDLNDEIELSDA
jgi:DNA-directed RNA polymerase subunit beta'